VVCCGRPQRLIECRHAGPMPAGAGTNGPIAGQIIRPRFELERIPATTENAMTTARDTLTAGATFIGEHETLAAAAQHMRHRVVAQADIARNLPEHAIVRFVRAICYPKALPATGVG
jgi:hypothetical protein